MGFLIALMFSVSLQAEVLPILDVRYLQPETSASCGLLKRRELERQKVIRELDYLGKLGESGKGAALLMVNNLISNKLFMPNETWRDLVAQVLVTTQIPEEMVQEMFRVTPDHMYISVEGPGLVWESFIYQIPEEMMVSIDPASRTMKFQYATYLNVICLGDRLKSPQIEWIRTAQAPSRPNTLELIQSLRALFKIDDDT